MTRVADYMTPGPHTIGREQSLVAAKQMMQKIQVRHLPVLRDDNVVGFISMRDLMNVELERKTEELNHMRQYIHGNA